ncbi:Alpha/Beta hydrolase protein [Mycena floridula]|nr:Alpha/Beta hydrolase protein [Mycena floridula]
MDASAYKQISVSRGFEYKYYRKAGDNEKPTLLLLHGFPSTSFDWRHQIAFFSNAGYGLIVPDMLGYGGTFKPTNVEAYKSTLICKDLVEILDSEKISKCIVIGHDWGSKFVSRLANYYPERFIAFAFLAVGNMPPSPQLVKFEDFLAEVHLGVTKAIAGYELFGYWEFLSQKGADTIVLGHMDSFMSLLFGDSELKKDNFAQTGGLEAWLKADKIADIQDYVSADEVKHHREILQKGGMAGPLCYYGIMTSKDNIDFNDNLAIPKQNIMVTKPVFFGAALRDVVALASVQKMILAKTCTNTTVCDYDAGHWVMVEKKDEVNRDLLAWIEMQSKL